ncbi:MAG: transposase [Rhodospirillales bacterium]|nr:transposase [Acetobacter sp.]
MLPEVVSRFGWLRHFWADSTYAGLSILATLREWFPRRGLRLEIVRAKEGVKGFAVQPKRWIIERTFAWLTHNRRLVRDYEQREVNSEAMILTAAVMQKMTPSALAAVIHCYPTQALVIPTLAAKAAQDLK